jgi:hypothetical protein
VFFCGVLSLSFLGVGVGAGLLLGVGFFGGVLCVCCRVLQEGFEDLVGGYGLFVI